MKIKAKKSFGQNFLINKKIQQQIVDAAEIDNEDVIEIGPGLGALTNLLLDKVKSLDAYELDNDIYQFWLEKKLPSHINFLNQDFLLSNLSSSKKRIVIGNIPYNITSEIIFKLIKNNQYLKHVVLMVQKEVGQRILATPNSKNYSKLSVSVQSIGSVSKILVAKANDFNPVPKVDSMVIKITFDQKNNFNLDEYLDFIKLCFQFKRKTLVNNLLTKYKKEKILDVLEQNKIDFLSRAENLDINQYKKIFFEFLK